MEYEVFEPQRDEFYDQACSAAYSRMFSEGREPYENRINADDLRVICDVPDNGHCASDDGNVWLKGA